MRFTLHLLGLRRLRHLVSDLRDVCLEPGELFPQVRMEMGFHLTQRLLKIHGIPSLIALICCSGIG